MLVIHEENPMLTELPVPETDKTYIKLKLSFLFFSFVINDKRNYLVNMKCKGWNYCYVFFFGKTQTRTSPVKVDNHQT